VWEIHSHVSVSCIEDLHVINNAMLNTESKCEEIRSWLGTVKWNWEARGCGLFQGGRLWRDRGKLWTLLGHPVLWIHAFLSEDPQNVNEWTWRNKFLSRRSYWTPERRSVCMKQGQFSVASLCTSCIIYHMHVPVFAMFWRDVNAMKHEINISYILKCISYLTENTVMNTPAG
jgi:hypothetical protein